MSLSMNRKDRRQQSRKDQKERTQQVRHQEQKVFQSKEELFTAAVDFARSYVAPEKPVFIPVVFDIEEDYTRDELLDAAHIMDSINSVASSCKAELIILTDLTSKPPSLRTGVALLPKNISGKVVITDAPFETIFKVAA